MTGIFNYLLAGAFGLVQIVHNWTSQSIAADVFPQNIQSISRPFVVAHRGLSMLAPENTLVSFEKAMASQADWIELDYYHTSDGVPVCFHDSGLIRTTNARDIFGESRKKVSDLTLEEFLKLDCGAWFSTEYAGTRGPTLEQALETITRSSVPLIERKDGDARTLCQLLEKRDWIKAVATQSFDWEFIADCHKLQPSMLVGVLGPIGHWMGEPVDSGDRSLTPEWVERAVSVGAGFIGWNRAVTPEGIQAAHQAGLKVLVYTINDPEYAAKLIQMGVDGIITDNPAVGWKGIALAHPANP